MILAESKSIFPKAMLVSFINALIHLSYSMTGHAPSHAAAMQHAHASELAHEHEAHAEHGHAPSTSTWNTFRHNIAHHWNESKGAGGMHRLGFFTNKFNPFALITELVKARRQARENRNQNKLRTAAEANVTLKGLQHMVFGKYFDPQMNRKFEVALSSLEWAKKKGMLEQSGLGSNDIEFLQRFVALRRFLSAEWNSLHTYWLKAQEDPEFAKKYAKKSHEYNERYNEFHFLEQNHGEHIDSLLVLGNKFNEDWKKVVKN